MSFEPFSVPVIAGHIQFLKDNRIFTANNENYEKGWLQPGMTVGFHAPLVVEPHCAFRKAPRLFSMGAFSFARSALPARSQVGRYSAVGDRLEVMDVDHPTDRLSVAAFAYRSNQVPITSALADRGLKHFAPALDRARSWITVGHDAWIGSNVLFKRGVTVGHGAVVGARSVVTRDVPPYAIVAGNPARVRRYRFSEDLIARLLASEWWRFHFADFRTMDVADPERLLGQFEEARAKGLEPWTPAPIALHEAFREIAEAAGHAARPIPTGDND